MSQTWIEIQTGVGNAASGGGGGGGGGTVTDVFGDAPITSTGGTAPHIGIPQASSSVNGFLSSSDFTTFSNKQPSGAYITGLTGDVSATGPGSVTATLATTGTAGRYIVVNTDSKGRVLSGSTGPLAISDGGTNAITANAAFANLSPMTTDQDLITRSGGVPVRFGIGANNTMLQVVGGALTWVATPSPYAVQTLSSSTATNSGTTYLCDTSSSGFSLTLPTPANGAFIIIKDKTGSFQTNSLTLIASSGSTKIEGIAAAKILQTNWGSWSFFSDATDWYMGPF